MHNSGYKSAPARRACRYSDARPPRKTDGVLLESEIPPRMRGKDHFKIEFDVPMGITPAYAGKSTTSWSHSLRRRDHPRVCGEKMSTDGQRVPISESPPHMRGKEQHHPLLPEQHGITPAYAGKSSGPTRKSTTNGDHPRICGEKYSRRLCPQTPSGLPPRMRGKAGIAAGTCRAVRITPAYAGKSVALLLNFPEMRGKVCRSRG